MTDCNEHQHAIHLKLADTAEPYSMAVLHRLAEERASRAESMQIEALSPEQASRLHYELRVHQIALEMQNEELQRLRKALEDSRARCATNDITVHKQSEQALRESEAMYRSILENAVDGFFQSTPEGRFIIVNPAFAEMLGYTSPTELVSAISDIARQYYADPQDRRRYQQILEQSGNVHDFEFRAVRKDGSQIWVSNSTRACYDPGGKLVRYEGIIKDITARKLAQAERERLLSAIEQAGEMFLITDAQGIIRYVNPAFERITGYSRAETMGHNPSLLKSGQQDQIFYQNLWQTISSGRTWQGRMVNRCKDGALITEEATISPVLDAQGRIVNYVAVKRDITEHLRLADQFQQAQKMESVGRLAGVWPTISTTCSVSSWAIPNWPWTRWTRLMRYMKI